ncbi:hypothetical protein DIPPA_08006 [Diplonema papillatum]|nr:hypothetical protein DIPPA_08006 [Diplonema papillatum]
MQPQRQPPLLLQGRLLLPKEQPPQRLQLSPVRPTQREPMLRWLGPGPQQPNRQHERGPCSTELPNQTHWWPRDGLLLRRQMLPRLPHGFLS